jgi:hypothetical protein
VAAPKDESVTLVETFFARYFHDEPIDDEAVLAALRTLRNRLPERYELSLAFEDVLESDVPPGFMTELVRRYANRVASSDEQARDFVAGIRDAAALDEVPEPDE